MWELFLWVPGKGWKLIRKFRLRDKAVDAAVTFEPLEVKLTDPAGRSYYGGVCHSPLEGCPYTITIDRMAEEAGREEMAAASYGPTSLG